MVVVGNGGLTQKQFCAQYGWFCHGGSHISMTIHGLHGRIQGGVLRVLEHPPGPYHITDWSCWLIGI